MAFNLATNAKAERKLVVTFVEFNEGTSSDPDIKLYPIGAGIEDSSIELSPDVSVVTDILGNTEAYLNKFELTQSFDPFTIRGGTKLAEDIFEKYMNRDLAGLSNYPIVIAYGFDGDEGEYVAERYAACTIVPTSIGGSSHVDMPIELNLSGERTTGTVSALDNTAVFTDSEAQTVAETITA